MAHVFSGVAAPCCLLCHPNCSTSPSFTLYLGTLGALSLSPALVLQLQSVFTQLGANWKAELLYVPCFIPFVVVSCVTLLVFRRELVRAGVHWTNPFRTAWQKLSGEGEPHSENS